ncbi:MAG: hypothetical protein JXR96_30820 [Deltaproteobacteria bacterium]|nr:hypothetical protein [Deltaproteobacteria bacterium]
MRTQVHIAAACWRQIREELDRVYPAEGLAIPLVWLRLRAGRRNPCAPVRLADIRGLVVARAVLVPPELQVNSAARVAVIRDATDALVNREIERLVQAHPRLRACAYLHSHPFARGRTWPSSGLDCDYEGHMLPLLRRNRHCNLETAFSFIACRSRSDPAGWKLQAFALDDQQRVVDLGFARVLDDGSPRLRPALLAGLDRRVPQRCLLRRWSRALRRAGVRSCREPLFDGFDRVGVEIGDGRRLVIVLPIDLPRHPARFFLVRGLGWQEIHPPEARSLAPDAWLRIARRLAASPAPRHSGSDAIQSAARSRAGARKSRGGRFKARARMGVLGVAATRKSI